MYKLEGGDIQFIGSCKHTYIRESQTILIYIGEPSVDLLEELDAFLHPEAYYTQQEISELDCVPSSQCYANKIAAEQRRLEAQRIAEWSRGQLKRGAIVQFDTDSVEPKDKTLLEQMADAAAGKKITVVIVGHTDSVGDGQYNNKLSLRRANRVKDLLVARGVDASVVQTLGKGETDPIASNKTSKGRTLNRRAVVKGEEHGDGN